MNYQLDTEYWMKYRKFNSFEIDTNKNEVRNLDLDSSWKTRKINTGWTNADLFEIYDDHGVGYIVKLFHRVYSDKFNKKLRGYAWLDIGVFNIELGECESRN